MNLRRSRRNGQPRRLTRLLQPIFLLLRMQHVSPVLRRHGPHYARICRTANASEVSVVIFNMMAFQWNNDDVSYASLPNTAARNANVLEEAQIPRRINTGMNIELAN